MFKHNILKLDKSTVINFTINTERMGNIIKYLSLKEFSYNFSNEKKYNKFPTITIAIGL